jgi:predicted NUDIX family phosphoesterase
LLRELREELELGAFCAEAIAFIHRENDEVSSIHIDILYRVQVVGKVKIQNTHELVGVFKTLAEIAKHCEARGHTPSCEKSCLSLVLMT